MRERTIAECVDELRYFWESKGDVERCCDWEEMQPLLQKERPEIIKAWADYKMAERIVSAVLKP